MREDMTFVVCQLNWNVEKRQMVLMSMIHSTAGVDDTVYEQWGAEEASPFVNTF